MIRKSNKYATLEEDYTELDGSFLLPNYNLRGDKAGYVSKGIFENIETPIFKISCSDSNFVKSSGITIYFENNIAQIFNIIITKDNDTIQIINVENNTKNIFQEVFEESITIKSLQIEILQMEYPNRRIRMSEVEFGISQIYEGNDLVSFDVNEEISLLMEKMPINTCSINLKNYPDVNNSFLFDPINPKGLVPYLTDNCVIIPNIGVLTEETGIEYVKMGTFFLKDWSDGNDGSVSLNGQNILGKLSGISITPTENNKFFNTIFNAKEMELFFNTMLNNNSFNFIMESTTKYPYNNNLITDINLLDWFKNAIPLRIAIKNNDDYVKTKFYVSRGNVITHDYLVGNSVEYISRNELITDVKYKTKETINQVDIISFQNYPVSNVDDEYEEAINASYTLSSDIEFAWFSIKNIMSINPNQYLSYTSSNGGEAKVIDVNYHLIYIKFQGTPGEVFTLKYKALPLPDLKQRKITYKNNHSNGNSISLDIRNSAYFDLTEKFEDIANFYLTSDYKYNVSGNMIGDPSLQTGDTITIETRFGDKDIILTKINIKFDGGLSENFEGVGN